MPVYMRLSPGTDTTEVTRCMGSKGIFELTEFGVSYTPQAGVDLSPSYCARSCGSSSRQSARANRYCRMPCSATTLHSVVTWPTSPATAECRSIGTRSRKPSVPGPRPPLRGGPAWPASSWTTAGGSGPALRLQGRTVGVSLVACSAPGARCYGSVLDNRERGSIGWCRRIAPAGSRPDGIPK